MFFVSPAVINIVGFKINTMDNGAVANMGTLQLIDQLLTIRKSSLWRTKTQTFPQ